eukprot:SAG31_NODE_1830_length_7152_cov_2.148306_7_plen_102_part_00
MKSLSEVSVLKAEAIRSLVPNAATQMPDAANYSLHSKYDRITGTILNGGNTSLRENFCTAGTSRSRADMPQVPAGARWTGYRCRCGKPDWHPAMFSAYQKS